jgi:hypothetical protein
MRLIGKRVPRRVAAIVSAVVILSVSGVGIAQGNSHPSASAAKGKKQRHTLDADWKTGPQDIFGEGERGADLEGSDEAKLEGRPFGKGKARLDESFRFTYNHSAEIPRNDYGGVYHVTFDADVIRRGKFRGTFRGFYDYAVDSEGNPSTVPAGQITGGSRELKGATGSFTIQNFHSAGNDPVKYAGRWKGSISY